MLWLLPIKALSQTERSLGRLVSPEYLTDGGSTSSRITPLGVDKIYSNPRYFSHLTAVSSLSGAKANKNNKLRTTIETQARHYISMNDTRE